MLQLNVQPFASDALDDAMRLAQTKALHSYSSVATPCSVSFLL